MYFQFHVTHNCTGLNELRARALRGVISLLKSSQKPFNNIFFGRRVLEVPVIVKMCKLSNDKKHGHLSHTTGFRSCFRPFQGTWQCVARHSVEHAFNIPATTFFTAARILAAISSTALTQPDERASSVASPHDKNHRNSIRRPKRSCNPPSTSSPPPWVWSVQ